ncbi:MAG: hypothetical protein ACM3WV_04260 [Bacillota bacterium]
MKLSAPKIVVWLIAVIVGLLGICMELGYIKIPALSGYAFTMVAGAFLLLAIANLIKGL